MPANFPTSPSTGDRHTIADKTWEWTGAVWDLVVSTNTLQFSGDDSSVITVNLTANEELRIVGDGTNISTTGSAGDSTNSTLQITLTKDIDINSISSADSTSVTVNDGLIVTGNFAFDGGVAVNTILDEDDLSSNSDTALATQQSIKAYVDSQITSTNTLSVADDTSSVIAINLDNTLTISGGDSLTTSVSGSTVNIDLDETITVDQINAGDSTSITFGSPIIVNSISSGDSTAVRINDAIETDGATINGNLSVTGNTTIDGNLTVAGTTTYIETTNTKVSDPLLLLNNGNSGGADVDSGIMVERGSAGNNAVFYWNEGEDVFKAVTTTSSESDVAITDTALANIRVAEPSDSSDAATKNYVDTEIAGLSTTIKFADDTSSVLTADLQNDTVSIAGGNSITSSITGDTITLALNSSIDVNEISSTDSTAVTVNDGLIVTGNLSFDGGVAVNTILDEDNMASNSDTALATQQSIKAYVDNAVAGGVGLLGTNIQLGYPTDSSTYPVGAINTLTPTHTVTDSIDDLNEALENVRNNTFVKSVDFTADNTVGGAGLVVTLTITTVGNPNRYDITWGDGSVTVGTTDTTPSHTYATNVGSPFDVTVRAYNNGGEGTGSESIETKSNYITIYTADPTVDFDIYAASTGGSAITKCDLGSTVYLENTTTNTTGATASFTIDWGDGITETIASNSADGGVDGARLAHTYNRPDAGDSSTTLVGDGDLRFVPRLTLTSHSTADPTQVPKSSATTYFYVYTEHDALLSVDGSVIRGINEEATGGFPVTFNNDTISDPGAYSIFNTNSGSNTYSWDFDEGNPATTVQIGSGSPGDTGVDISNIFDLPIARQNDGTTVNFTTTLTIANGHTNSPFTANIIIKVEPDVRANIAGTADTVSDKSGDNQYDLYDFTDLNGNNRSSVTFTNTSQHGDDYEYDYFNDSTDVFHVTEDGSSAGTIAATLTKDFSGTGVGSFTTRFRTTGTPDTFHQSDEENIVWTMNATPTAPDGVSAKLLTLADAVQGTSPKLCASYSDNTGSLNSLSAGASLSTTTARRYTSGTIDSSTITQAYNGASGTLTANINGSSDGNIAFNTSNNSGTYTSLVVTSNSDAHDAISASTYPSDFYQVFNAKITKALTGYTVGLNAQRLEHSATGNTNEVHVLYDDVTATPTTTIGTVSENVAGTYQYISGVPYYDSGSPSLTVTSTTIANLTGQAYADISNPHEIEPGTVSSGSGSIIANIDYTYANIDGGTTMLSGGIPITDTGVASAYTIGALTVPLTSSNMFSVSTIKARSQNCNGAGSYSEDSTKIQVFTATATGINQENGGIVVSDSLGSGFDDDAVRIYGPSAFYSDSSSTSVGDTPQYNSDTDFYTTHLFQGSSADIVAGTDEAMLIPSTTATGTIKHDVTDFSSGYLPVGPDRSSDTGAQYYTIAFRRTVMANFTITLTGTVSGVYIASPGTQIDSTSTLNGWLDASITYGGSGVPGADTGAGGNGSNGCAFTSGDRIIDGTPYSSQSFTLTLGSENATNATGNVVMVRFKLQSGDSITAVSIA